MAGQQTRVVCPVCLLSRMDSAFKRTDDKRYGQWDEDTKIIEFRDAPGGKRDKLQVGSGHYRRTPGKGFPITGTLTIDEAKKMSEYDDYIEQISNQLIKVVTIFYRQDLITSEDLESIISG